MGGGGGIEGWVEREYNQLNYSLLTGSYIFGASNSKSSGSSPVGSGGSLLNKLTIII